MEVEQLAKKRHRCRDGTLHYKVFYWFGGWHFLTGQFGKVNGNTVAQARNRQGKTVWVYENSNLVNGNTVKDVWSEKVKDVTDTEWGV